MNAAPLSNDDALEELTSQAADEFMELLERGEAPDIETFVAERPQIAGVLRGLLPALQAMRESDGGSKPDIGLPHVEPERLGRLGDFEIVREVGRGGMGVVYEAVQISLGRRVALKVLAFAAMLDPHRLQRFQNEARAAACLHHSNIVPVFAVGCDRGVHFYAMQYIEGRNLAALIQDARRQSGLSGEDGEESGRRMPSTGVLPGESVQPVAATEPGGALSTQRTSSPKVPIQTAVRLAVQAAEALHHAHQEGVVHRDVKPANIMVDGTGNLWVTDFGLAQVQSDPRLTVTGNLIGTLRYMSPEQASGEQVVDHRTDIFSLGATLYELLALRPACPGRDRAAVLRQIAQNEPTPLRRANSAVPADLETIVAKAMARNSVDRYVTAQALADDLRRFLADKPILAKRPSLLEKAAKWSRRRRGLVATAIGVLLVAVCGLSIAMALIWAAYNQTKLEKEKADKEKEKATLAFESANQERARAEEAADKAREVLDFFTQVSAKEFPDTPDLRPIRRKLLERALGYYEDFIDQQGDDPSVQGQLVASQLRIASLLEDMGKKEDALAMFEQIRTSLRSSPTGSIPGMPYTFGLPALSVSSLLTQPSVKKDLKLSESQVKAIAALADKRRQWDEQEAYETACFEVLRPEQAKRLRQIIWQQRGAHVFADPDVADALQLTADQRQRIRKIEDDARRPGRSGEPQVRSGDHRPSDMWKQHEDDYWKNVSDRLTAVLTDEQKTTWKTMAGDPFQGEVRFSSSPSTFVQAFLRTIDHHGGHEK